METLAIILFVMKANHSIIELGEYKTMDECMKALQWQNKCLQKTAM